jgi:N-acetylglutamate synthase-like GNAT family acetyltransferase
VTEEFMSEIEIIPYNDELKIHFENLNREWLEKYFYVEPVDEEIFKNPKRDIIDKGGHIYFALKDSEVVGTCALIKKKNYFELAKMAVTDKYQGLGIGKKLLVACLNKAEDLNAPFVELCSHRKLGPALHLYKKVGFKEVPISEEYKKMYARCNIQMIYEF